MSFLDFALSNLLSPAILCFALGGFAVLLRSDLKLPEQAFSALSIYLMLAIGLKGGVELAGRPFSEVATPVAAALALGCAIPLWCYAMLKRFAGLSISDAAAMAAHYGSVSAVTFAAVIAMLTQQGVAYEGYAAALLAIMEVPAIVIALALSRVAVAARASGTVQVGGGVAALGTGTRGGGANLTTVLSDTLASKSVVLLAGGLLIGLLIGPTGMTRIKPVFVDLFQGMLCLFLLELGRMAASRIGEFGKVGLKLGLFAIVMPVVHGALGIAVAYAAGMSQGGAIVLGTLAASASYIAAPAAVRLALPDANPSYYLTCSLAITFPFNIIIGLPLYSAMAAKLYG